MYPDLASLILDLVNQDPDGLLAIAKQQQILTHKDAVKLYRDRSQSNQSLEISNRMVREQLKVEIIRTVANKFLQRGDAKKAFEVFKLLLYKNFYVRWNNMNDSSSIALDGALALRSFTLALAKKGATKETVEAAGLLFKQRDNDSWHVMSQVLDASSSGFAKKADLKGFLRVFDVVPDKGFKEQLGPNYVARFCRASLEFDHVGVAFEAAQRIPDKNQILKAGQLLDVSKAFLEQGDAQKAFEAARQVTLKGKGQDVQDRQDRKDLRLEFIVDAFLEKGEVGEARAAAQLIGNDETRRQLLSNPRFTT